MRGTTGWYSSGIGGGIGGGMGIGMGAQATIAGGGIIGPIHAGAHIG